MKLKRVYEWTVLSAKGSASGLKLTREEAESEIRLITQKALRPQEVESTTIKERWIAD